MIQNVCTDILPDVCRLRSAAGFNVAAAAFMRASRSSFFVVLAYFSGFETPLAAFDRKPARFSLPLRGLRSSLVLPMRSRAHSTSAFASRETQSTIRRAPRRLPPETIDREISDGPLRRN